MEKKQGLNMQVYRNHPRKGIYDLSVKGFKAFNNAQQTETGQNAMKEQANDDFCKERYIFVSLTALENNQNINLRAES